MVLIERIKIGLVFIFFGLISFTTYFLLNEFVEEKVSYDNNQSSTTQSSTTQSSNSEFADYSYEVSSHIRNTIGYEVEMMWRSSNSVYRGSMINWYEQKKHSFIITVDSEGNVVNANVGYGEPLY